ncbi:MAG: ATP-dependent helicase HrpB, partial [Polyangiaceae bacterium]|nr:ATP-dependent helicase HrpB [Polyangiaceae bacterium]
EVLYGGVSLDRSVRRDVEGPEVARLLAEAALRLGVDRLWDADAREQLARRLAFAASNGLEVRPIDAPLLAEAVESLAVGARGLADLRARSLVDAIVALEPPAALARLASFAPETVSIPGRPRVAVTYEVDRPPWIESRLQDFFGAKTGPAIADGRVPLTLHLLAPNQRAVQVTTDLAGFWDRHYPAIRKELMRRYPRHAWPDDPRTAAPSRPKPRH